MKRDLPSASVTATPRNRFSLSWLVPTFAIIATVILYFRWEMNRGPVVTIEFIDTSGLTTDSPIVYRGAIVGRVENIELDPDLSSVVVHARLNSSAADLAREGTQWWIVRPTVSLQGVSGLDTIMGPRYIQLQPGHGRTTLAFVGSPTVVHTSGKTFTLVTDFAKSVTVGAPIFYRGFEIGEVTFITLAQDSKKVLLNIIIEEKYASLIRTNTIFWNEGGIRFDANLFGINLRTGPLASLIKGGISTATPEEIGDIAQEGHEFSIKDDFDEDWLEWSPEIPLNQQLETE